MVQGRVEPRSRGESPQALRVLAFTQAPAAAKALDPRGTRLRACQFTAHDEGAARGLRLHPVWRMPARRAPAVSDVGRVTARRGQRRQPEAPCCHLLVAHRGGNRGPELAVDALGHHEQEAALVYAPK